MSLVHYASKSGVAVLRIENPPVNALSSAVRSGILRALGDAVADDRVTAIVIAAGGPIFSGGADIREFDQAAAGPALAEVLTALETCPKVIVAAIQGPALGGGLELTMACHGRVCTQTARFALPEVTLGLIPGAGGTQRLPRLVPLTKALSMIVLGQAIDAGPARECGLIDRITADDTLQAEARDCALHLAAQGHRRTCDRPLIADDDPLTVVEAFGRDHARQIRGRDAPAAALEALRNAVRLPFDEAIACERAVSLHLRTTPQSAALRHLHFAERQVFKIPELTAVAPRTIERVGIVGAGTMGVGIALAMMSAGLCVSIVEPKPDALERATAAIHNTMARNIAAARITEELGDAALRGLTTHRSYDDLSDADLVIEAAYENIAVKKAVFADLDRVARPGAILASNTSYLDIDAIAAATTRPTDVVGLHFFSPAHIMKLLEVVRGAETSSDVLATAFALARRIGKIPVLAGNRHGFIGNRMLAVRRTEAEAMLMEGASVDAVDAVIEGFGFPMGPFRMADLAGLDLGWEPASSRGATLRERLNEAGRHGQKAGAGFYDYDEARNPRRSTATANIVQRYARDRGIAQRPIDAEEMSRRLFLPLIDEGIRILAEGTALRPGDIDVVWVNGYGWPRHTGGPMHYAESIGLAAVADGLRAIGRSPSPALQAVVAGRALLSSLARDDGAPKS